ncbi:MAG: lipoate--protein ligase family protein [Thaumarchaeota archaeon]|nr:lipoate--protein ligase family protein [Nitrososphaerota archaeon]
MRGRLLELSLGDPYSNLALEEAIFESVEAPTLRIWDNQRSVVIGRAQLAEHETDLDYCRRNSVPVVRRMTAGGAVYNGPGNLNWSFFFPRDLVPGGGPALGAKRVFSSFAGMVVETLRRCGAECEFVAPNSIVDGRGKVSGMAAYLSRKKVLCHGTLLFGADLEEVQRLTRPSPARIEKRYPRSRFTEVSNCRVGREDFVREMARAGGFEFEPGGLSRAEEEASRGLLARYRSEEWNLGDPFAR